MIPKEKIALGVSSVEKKTSWDAIPLPPVSSVIKTKNINNRNKNGMTHLMLAAINGDMNLVRWLIHLGADVNRTDFEGLHAGWWAARHSRWNIVSYLLEHGLKNLNAFPVQEVDRKEDEDAGATILWFAASDERWDMVEKLIVDYGVRQLDAAPFSGEYASVTPLHFACRAGNLSSITLLVNNGASVNFTDRISPLMTAFSYPEVCDYLISKAGVYVDDVERLKISHEFRRKYEEESHLLRIKIISARDFFDHIKKDKLTFPIIKMLLSCGAHLNQRSILNGNAPLHYAIEFQSINSAKAILEYVKTHFSWNQRLELFIKTNKHGLTPLDWVLKNEGERRQLTPIQLIYLNAVQELINHFAIKLVTLNASHRSSTPKELLIEIFLKYLGINLLAKTEKGKKYLAIAINKVFSSAEVDKILRSKVEQRNNATYPSEKAMSIKTENDKIEKDNIKKEENGTDEDKENRPLKVNGLMNVIELRSANKLKNTNDPNNNSPKNKSEPQNKNGSKILSMRV